VLIREDGTVVGWGRSGATSYRSITDCQQALRHAVTEAVQNVDIGALWAAHTWFDHGLNEWMQQQGVPIVCFMRVQEWDIVFHTAGKTWGIVVHAGTGSWVQCRTPDGRMPRIGGMGPFFGDEGSGWDLGFRGIKAALRSSWSYRRQTSLAEAVPQALKVDNLLEAVVGDPITSGKITRAQIASVAPTVLAEAVAGDAVAMQVVDAVAQSLVDMCLLLLEDLDVAGCGYPLIGAAGVIQNSAFYWQILIDKILCHDSTLVPEIAPFKMGVGAAMMAMQAAGVPLTQDLRDRIILTQASFPFAYVPTLQSKE
jgi:N-acetylglucosamine kinase-like BadF-type ATPase